ncbi:hypothetical protein HF521_018874 [Silurus meridionalis]|uniref:Peptidase S1 domain-containing protein n=1 Tax=Silurus meridionalis TaxID=175797 RepID=A0A8T0BQH2_SILME|nr:hypothetical protein HF521_018874 [Silurus meridionalis]
MIMVKYFRNASVLRKTQRNFPSQVTLLSLFVFLFLVRSFQTRNSCIVAGWKQTKERGRMASVFHEVQLDLVDLSVCEHILQTLRLGLQNFTVLCAGPGRGGKDACRGDSCGPLLCPRANGQMVVVGITSWGKICGCSWINNKIKPRIPNIL